MRAIGVIPARYDSTRLPGKPLADINGMPMIQWVYERASRSVLLDEIIVATDDERIKNAVQDFGGRVVMTPKDIPSGTDRVAYVAEGFISEIIVNIQGDEPLIEWRGIDQAVRLLLDDEDAEVSTLAYEISDPAELTNMNTVRVVVNRKGDALYFSRAAIPFIRDCADSSQWLNQYKFLNHIGLYVFRKEFLLQYTRLERTPLETAENLEQLRILENGFRIKVGITNEKPLCIDTEADLQKVREEVRRKGL